MMSPPFTPVILAEQQSIALRPAEGLRAFGDWPSEETIRVDQMRLHDRRMMGLGECTPHRGGGFLWRRRDDLADHRPRQEMACGDGNSGGAVACAIWREKR